MSNLNEFIKFGYESAYDFAYDLPMKKKYSSPKIYTANGDLKKRWYVYFSYQNPETGRLKRITPYYGSANKYKTKEDRLYVLSVYRKKILELLKLGFDPFADNSHLVRLRQDQKTNQVPVQKTKPKILDTERVAEILVEEKEETGLTVKEAFDFALTIKKQTINQRTYKDYSRKIKNFLQWLEKSEPEVKFMGQLTKKNIQQYLNEILISTSARNRNNTRVDLSSLMQVLEENEIIPSNFIKSITILKTNPERNKTYSNEKQQAIFKHLEEKDPHLLLFIKFISYNFLRPIEVCRIKIGDINLEQKTIRFKAKNKANKTKIIPDILFKELPDLSNFNPEDYLFTQHKLGGKWDALETNKRDYFSKRFKKEVKEHFKLGKDYGLYSFRHTYITKLYRELRKNAAPFEAKSTLMLITGHATMTALEKYLRDIDAELPTDYSKLLTETNC
jgi:integrase